MSHPDVEEERHALAPEGRKRGTTFRIATRYTLLSLGLRKIRDFPENSEKISGGEKSPKQDEPRSIQPRLAWKRTYGRRFIHLSLSVRGAPPSPSLCLPPRRSITRYIHNTRRMPVGRRPSMGRANIINSLLPLPLLRTAAAAAPVILSDYTDTDGPSLAPSLTLKLGPGRGIGGIRLRAAGGCCRILPLHIHVLGGRILQRDGRKHLLWSDLPHAGMAAAAVGQGEQKTALQVFFVPPKALFSPA